MNHQAKRVLDLTASFIFLAVLSPVLGLIALAILLTSGRPVFLQQTRPGLHAKPFVLLKFRTMNGARNANGELLPDGDRITRLGSLLRRSSLDELPELWNVLKGQMSLVGPRPLLMDYVDRYTPEQARRHDAKPGLTGWAQVNGRNALTWPEKFSLDLWYVDNWSLGLDMQILFRTLSQFLSWRDIAHPGHATMPEFHGTQARVHGIDGIEK
jgi:sugar transferase EpsL